MPDRCDHATQEMDGLSNRAAGCGLRAAQARNIGHNAKNYCVAAASVAQKMNRRTAEGFALVFVSFGDRASKNPLAGLPVHWDYLVRSRGF